MSDTAKAFVLNEKIKEQENKIAQLTATCLEKDLEIFKLKKSYCYEQICEGLNKGKRLLSVAHYYVEHLIPIIDHYGLPTIEKALVEMAKKEPEQEQQENE